MEKTAYYQNKDVFLQLTPLPKFTKSENGEVMMELNEFQYRCYLLLFYLVEYITGETISKKGGEIVLKQVISEEEKVDFLKTREEIMNFLNQPEKEADFINLCFKLQHYLPGRYVVNGENFSENIKFIKNMLEIEKKPFSYTEEKVKTSHCLRCRKSIV